jgi:hypothetical protein
MQQKHKILSAILLVIFAILCSATEMIRLIVPAEQRIA